ncbi:MAG: hypothetical protein ACOCRX_09790 [Candidatus Woesearchaeota archaeon]
MIKIDLKCYCTKYFYDRYRNTGFLIACSPKTREKLIKEDRRNKDLNVKLSLNRNTHYVKLIENIPVEGNWYEIRKK